MRHLPPARPLIPVALLIVIAVLVALQGRAQFPAADQVFLPSAISIKAPWASYLSSVRISNESNDRISVSATYTKANESSASLTKRDVVKLDPHQRAEFPDFVGVQLSSSGFGSIVFNGCLDGADCTGASTANYRAISVTSRSYVVNPVTGGTVGQNLDALPWWAYGDARHPLTITGITVSEQARTNLGVVNASDMKPVTLTATLYDGATHAQRDQATITLAPSGGLQRPATDMFPLLGQWSRLNRGRAATNACVVFTSNGNDDAFFVYGSLIDVTTNDATTLTAYDPTSLADAQIASLYGTPPPTGASSVRLSAKSASATVETNEQCMRRTLGPRSKFMVDALAEAMKLCSKGSK